MAAEQQFNIKFVQEVEKYPCLYNYKLPEYMRKDKTEKVWGEIGNKFQLTGPECKEKWKNLRSVFVRHLKPPKSGSATKKPYYLADYMQFAVPYIKIAGNISGNLDGMPPEEPRAFMSQCSSTQPEAEIPPSILQPQPSTSTQSETDIPPSILQSQPLTSTQSEAEIPPAILQPQSSTSSVRSQLQSRLPPIQQAEFESQQRQPRPKKNYRKKDETPEKDIANYFKIKQAKVTESSENSEQSSNKMFLLSILSDMNKMKDIQRRVFKRRLLALVDEIMAEEQDIVLNSPITLLSTPSPINADIPVDTSTMNDDSNSQLTLYYQSIPLLLSNQDNQNTNDNTEDQEK